MTRYRVIDTMAQENEQYLSDDVSRAVDDDRVYVLEAVEGPESKE